MRAIIQDDPHIFHQEGGIQVAANTGAEFVINLHPVAGDVDLKAEVLNIFRENNVAALILNINNNIIV